MSKTGNPGRGSTVERAVMAVRFVQTHRTWTIEDLSTELGVNKKNGRQYLAALSLYLPIAEIKPARYGYSETRCTGRLPSIYSLMKTE